MCSKSFGSRVLAAGLVLWCASLVVASTTAWNAGQQPGRIPGEDWSRFAIGAEQAGNWASTALTSPSDDSATVVGPSPEPVSTTPIIADAPIAPTCPAGTLLGHDPIPSDQYGNLYTSAEGPGFDYTVYDKFTGVPGKIGSISWWGALLFPDPDAGDMLPCDDPSAVTFEITFYTHDGTQPGEVACVYTDVVPLVTEVGAWGSQTLYYFEVPELTPCCALSTGWMSVRSTTPDGCVFAWMTSYSGEWTAYQQSGDGGLTGLQINMAFCLGSGNCPDTYGACCDWYTGQCDDGIEEFACQPPRIFTPNAQCSEVQCGTTGACCDSGLQCVLTGYEADCDAVGGMFYPGEDCVTFDCPDECLHRVELYSCHAYGWGGATLDVLVNGVPALADLTLPSTGGPLTFEFAASTGDSIETVFHNTGDNPYEPYYRIYGGNNVLLGFDGVEGNFCGVVPTGISVVADCEEPVAGACCYGDYCEMVATEQECVGGEFLGIGHTCLECPCVVTCPPEAIPEPEPCGENLNGGCTWPATNMFSPIQCGDVICGTLYTILPRTVDHDWYQITTDDWYSFTWSVVGEVPMDAAILKAPEPNSCEYELLGYVDRGECHEASLNTICLQPGTYYFFVCPAVRLDAPCPATYTASLTCEPCTPIYCPAYADPSREHIARVQVGTIDNVSGGEGYTDFTHLSTDLAYGTPTSMTVTNGYTGQPNNYCEAWIDYDHDTMFDDETESLGTFALSGPYEFMFSVPEWALAGETRMRIRLAYGDSDPEPCGVETYPGEVEDYTVNIVDVLGACCTEAGCSLTVPQDCTGYWAGPDTVCPGLDCNDNGFEDLCDIAGGTSQDCNDNGVPDECDVNGASLDCNGDGIPDECEVLPWDDYVYQWDGGGAGQGFGLSAGGYIVWMNHYQVASDDAAKIGTVQIAYGPVPELPVTVCVWSDPDQDGDPLDAILVSQAESMTINGGSGFFNVVDVPDVYIGPAGTHFFVGATMYNPPSRYPIWFDDDDPMMHSYMGGDSEPINPNMLGDLETTLAASHTIGIPLDAGVRAVVVMTDDCNDNGVPDECDIGVNWGGLCEGAECSTDVNSDGVPDECQVCGDINEDGAVDVSDYWMLIASFGRCDGDANYNAACDLNGDGCVTFVDFQQWTLCFELANGGEKFVAPPRPQSKRPIRPVPTIESRQPAPQPMSTESKLRR